jgi:hypothetical protein
MLFCLTATYTKKALEAMAKNPKRLSPRSSRAIDHCGGRQVSGYVWHNSGRTRRDGDI